MKLTKLVTVNDVPYALNTDEIKLDLDSPGRAAFTVTSETPLTGIVKYSMGYDPNDLQLYFTGVIESSFQIDKKQQSIFCRELTSVLNQMMPLSLRNVSLNEVLASIGKISGLEFVTPDQPYAQKKAPAFYSVGGGYHCMDVLARVFRIPRMIWQQQGDGKIFVGSWEHSFWGDKAIDLPVDFQKTTGIANTAEVPAAPKLRPGVKLTNGGVITAVTAKNESMILAWQPSPWGSRWKNKSTVQ